MNFDLEVETRKTNVNLRKKQSNIYYILKKINREIYIINNVYRTPFISIVKCTRSIDNR